MGSRRLLTIESLVFSSVVVDMLIRLRVIALPSHVVTAPRTVSCSIVMSSDVRW